MIRAGEGCRNEAEAAKDAADRAALVAALDSLQEATIHKDGKRITTRTPVADHVGRVFQA